jgi:hypothetical protein
MYLIPIAVLMARLGSVCLQVKWICGRKRAPAADVRLTRPAQTAPAVCPRQAVTVANLHPIGVNSAVSSSPAQTVST